MTEISIYKIKIKLENIIHRLYYLDVFSKSP